MNYGFTVVDKFGRPVTLDHSNRERHLLKRPDLAPYHHLVPIVLRDPDLVNESARDGHYHFFRWRLTAPPHEHCAIRVVVQYFDQGTRGKVMTAWLSSSVAPLGIIRWMRLPPRS